MGIIRSIGGDRFEYLHYGFPAGTGLNSYSRSAHLKDSELQDLQNGRVGGGVVSKRPGRLPLNANPIVAAEPVTSIYRYVASGGTAKTYATCKTGLYYFDTTDFSNIANAFSNGKYWHWATCQDYAIGTNGVDAIQKVSGTTTAALGGSPPVSDDVCYHSPSGRLMVIPTADSSAIQWSPKNNMESWNALDKEYIAKGAGPNRRLFDYGIPGLIVGKDRSMHVVRGALDFRGDIVIDPIDAKFGLASAFAGIVIGTDFYYVRSDLTVQRWSGTPRFEDIGAAIQPALDAINQAQAAKIYVTFLDKKLFVAVPYGTSQATNNRIFVYDPKIKGWAFDLQPAASFAFADSAQEAAQAGWLGDYAGNVHQFEVPQVWLDGAGTVTTIFKFRDHDANMPHWRKIYEDFFFTAESTAAGNITATWSVDGDDLTGDITVALVNNNYSFYRIAPASRNCAGASVSLKLTHALNGGFAILGWGYTFRYDRPLGMGVDA